MMVTPCSFYWVTGPKLEFTAAKGTGPKKVMCWQEDRDGGGWTLATKHWYGQHHHFAGSGRRQTNNINSGVMAHLGQYYKLDDVHIRTYVGQPDPTNDDFNAKASMVSYMHDQNGHDARGSNGNFEWSMLKQYTARWYWYTWHQMPESSTTTELSFFYWDQSYDGSLKSVGEGELNWRGNPVCGNWNGAGTVLVFEQCFANWMFICLCPFADNITMDSVAPLKAFSAMAFLEAVRPTKTPTMVTVARRIWGTTAAVPCTGGTVLSFSKGF
jgi:hypothetical protein